MKSGQKDVPDKHHRITHTDDMQRCSFLIRGTKPCKSRCSADSHVCQYHEPSRLAKERGLSVLSKRPRTAKTTPECSLGGDTMGSKGSTAKGKNTNTDDNCRTSDNGDNGDDDGDDADAKVSKKNDITRISGSQNRMYNPLATPLVDLGCVGLPTEHNWKSILNNIDLPIHLDIGCARGKFLIDLAEMNPDRNYIGIEIRNKLVEEANEILESSKSSTSLESSESSGSGHRNCVFFCANLLSESHRLQLEQSFSSRVISRISILFPDPWIKKKHQARRVVQVSMLISIAKILCKGGELIIVSDVRDVIDDARTKVLECGDLFAPVTGRQSKQSKTTASISIATVDHLNGVADESKNQNNDNDTRNDHSPQRQRLEQPPRGQHPEKYPEEHSGEHPEEHSLFEMDSEGFVLSNPFKPLASEREQVCEMSWRRVFRLIYIRK